MKKIIIGVAVLSMMCGSAFAQGQTGPAGQSDNVQRPGVNNMERGSMNNGTTGMSNDGVSRNNTTNSGMVKPDASGQGGAGSGSDQGGTRAAPDNRR